MTASKGLSGNQPHSIPKGTPQTNFEKETETMNALKRIRDSRPTTAIGKDPYYVVDWVDLNRIAQTANTKTVYYGDFYNESGTVCACFVSSAFEFDCGGYENSRCVDRIYLALPHK